MTTVAIISEYNPFHSGHKHQIDSIRREFGEDTAIIAIMSGNFTQRGELAILPKGYRAKSAVLSGVDLVLELPFPFSSSSAEFFAKSGVTIADKIGVVDYLSFGSESGDVMELIRAADIFDSPEYTKAFASLSSDKTKGYPEKCEAAYNIAGGKVGFSFTPNNILALEYIRALKFFGSRIKPHTVKREGAGYLEEDISEGSHQSAMAIRRDIFSGSDEAMKYLPLASRNEIDSAIEKGDAPADIARLSPAIISFFRLNSSHPSVNYHDAGDGLYNRLYNSSFEANDINTLLSLTDTKIYTRSRIRRAILNCYLGVTSSDVRSYPSYTQILAMNSVGMLLLKKMRKCSDIRILNKPSYTDSFSDSELREKGLSDKADSIYELSKPIPKSGYSALTFTPFIKR